MQTITTGDVEASTSRSASLPDHLKAFFVGDNRSTVGWGRGASLALGQLLTGSFDITGRITGDFFDLSMSSAGYVGTIMPPRYYRQFRYSLLRECRRPFSWYLKLERMFGAKDFISEDPTESVDNLLAHKRRHEVLARIYDEAAEADLLVLDGNGDIIFSTPPRRQTLFLLAMIELGVRLGKPVFLVNSMISDCPLTGRNVETLKHAKRLLGRCRAVVLRDPHSLTYVREEIPEADSHLIPDSLFAWFPYYEEKDRQLPRNGDFLLPHPERDEYWGKLDFSQPYICIGGGALAGSDPKRSMECYGRLVDGIRRLGCRVYLTENDSSDWFLQRIAREKNIGIIPVDAPILMCGAVLANARLFISGRYHPSIFASIGGTPCIFLASHAHKMGSLSQVLEYDVHREFGAFPDDSEVAEIVSLAQSYLNQGETLRSRIRQVARSRCSEAMQLPTFLKTYMERSQRIARAHSVKQESRG
ncbi:MAG TPA: polysaccharide pyruvyl transferase family protein [Terriglobales bacterium]|nr:polysaccharide pyruvyl transferase family protein [Terriglobales bacterium]